MHIRFRTPILLIDLDALGRYDLRALQGLGLALQDFSQSLYVLQGSTYRTSELIVQIKLLVEGRNGFFGGIVVVRFKLARLLAEA